MRHAGTQDRERGRADTSSSHGFETSQSMDDGQANDGPVVTYSQG